jgi:hypothetical protein
MLWRPRWLAARSLPPLLAPPKPLPPDRELLLLFGEVLSGEVLFAEALSAEGLGAGRDWRSCFCGCA